MVYYIKGFRASIDTAPVMLQSICFLILSVKYVTTCLEDDPRRQGNWLSEILIFSRYVKYLVMYKAFDPFGHDRKYKLNPLCSDQRDAS